MESIGNREKELLLLKELSRSLAELRVLLEKLFLLLGSEKVEH